MFAVVPFGGGTNISGSLEAPAAEDRTIVSIDMARMDRVVEIDDASRIARIQAGAFGPALEEQLNARGWTVGHFPDSFTHSTLGGWIATRSSGMQSDKYGDVADLTRAVRVVTPTGTLVTRPVPTTSTGPSVREMVLGKERDFKLGTRDMQGSKDVVDLVGHTPCAIGYSGLGYATPEVTAICVAQDKSSDCIIPTLESAKSGTYPLSRPLFMYTLGQPTGPVLAYLDWIKSDAGQTIVADNGFVPIN